MVPSNHSLFQYCDSNIGLFFNAPCYCNIEKINGKKFRKEAMNQSTKLIQKFKQRD